jgi:hypothetical protein
MKFLTIATTLLAASSCSAFAPSVNGVSRTQALNAKTLEGWKIDGTVKPVNNFILIQKTEDEKQTDTGILLSNKVRLFNSYFTVYT